VSREFCAIERGSLVTKLARRKQVSTFQDAQTGRHWYCVKVLDSHVHYLFILMFDCDFEHVSFLGLQQKEESALEKDIDTLVQRRGA